MKHGGAIAQTIQRLWGPQGSGTPFLAGPDDAGDGSSVSEFGDLVRSQSFLRAITFHAYAFHHGGGPTPSLLQDLVNASKLDAANEVYGRMLREVEGAATDSVSSSAQPTQQQRTRQYEPEVWMGEGNAAGYGGRRNVTNTLANSFWYLNALGSAAQQGVQRFDEAQGKGFICWRFIDEFRSKEG